MLPEKQKSRSEKTAKAIDTREENIHEARHLYPHKRLDQRNAIGQIHEKDQSQRDPKHRQRPNIDSKNRPRSIHNESAFLISTHPRGFLPLYAHKQSESLPNRTNTDQSIIRQSEKIVGILLLLLNRLLSKQLLRRHHLLHKFIIILVPCLRQLANRLAFRLRKIPELRSLILLPFRGPN